MASEKRLIDANAIPWEEYYVPDPDRNAQWDFKKEWSVSKTVVDQMPTVEAVEVVHGRWIPVPSSDMMTGKAYKCSECNKMRYGSFMPNYCQNCGAKMDGDGNA